MANLIASRETVFDTLTDWLHSPFNWQLKIDFYYSCLDLLNKWNWVSKINFIDFRQNEEKFIARRFPVYLKSFSQKAFHSYFDAWKISW